MKKDISNIFTSNQRPGFEIELFLQRYIALAGQNVNVRFV